MPLHHVAHQRESQPASALTLGSKERLQNPGQLVRRYPAAAICNCHAQSASLLSAPLVRLDYSRLYSSAFGHGVGSIQNEIREYLPQETSIHAELSLSAVAGIHRNALCFQARLVEVSHGVQQLRHVRALQGCRLPGLLQRRMCDLGNLVNFFLDKRQVMTSFFRQGGLRFYEVEEVQE